jgi:hypothetical protein
MTGQSWDSKWLAQQVVENVTANVPFKVTQVKTKVEMAGSEGRTQPRAIFGVSHGR